MKTILLACALALVPQFAFSQIRTAAPPPKPITCISSDKKTSVSWNTGSLGVLSVYLGQKEYQVLSLYSGVIKMDNGSSFTMDLNPAALSPTLKLSAIYLSEEKLWKAFLQIGSELDAKVLGCVGNADLLQLK